MKKYEPNQEKIEERLSELLDVLTADERKELMSHMSICEYKKNETIYAEGETPQQLLCLVKGKAKIYKAGIGRIQTLRIVQAVEFFGFRAAFSGQAFITAAAAFEPSVIIKFPLSVVEKLIKGNSQLGWFFIKKLATALGKSDERTVSLAQKHIRARLADSILYLKECYGLLPDGQTLNCYIRREDMGHLSNMTTSNAIRTLGVFDAEGVIALSGRKIKIIDEEQLRHISSLG